MPKRKSVTGIKKRRKRLETVPSVPAPSAFPQSAPGSVASSFPELTATSINTSSTSSILGRKRKEADTEDTPVDIGRDSHTRFAALRPRLRHVQQDVIKTKWEVLPESVQERVREVFKSVERPVIYKHREERRKIEAQVAVGSIVRTLGKRLPRMPFPPNTKEVQFNYESLLEGNRDLEKRLTPTLHSIALLSDAINKAEEAIAISRDDLAELEMNAKAELGLSQRLRAKRHLLLCSNDDKEHEDRPDHIGLVLQGQKKPLLSDKELDPSLKTLMTQMQSHLDSMGTNLMQVTGIRHALLRSSSTLGDTMYHRLKSPYDSTTSR